MKQQTLISQSNSFFHKSAGLVLALLVMLYSALSMADSLKVETDRQNVEMGDIITLAIEADFQSKGSKLDISLLEDQFDVINSQQSNQIEIVNGSYNSYTRWRLQILPKQVGKLMIPPFELNGVKSKPYPINVTEAQYADGQKPYFLEAIIDKQQSYVQEQVIYTLRFYHKGSLINGNIRPPKFENALVESLKEQSVFGKTIEGQQYTVYEWQYALFPQASGDFKIAGPSFTGLLNLRGKQKGVQSVAKDTIVKVLAAEKSPAPYWLPASSLTLSQEWQKLPKTINVGDSLRRVITLKVAGLKTTQLPTITTQNGSTYKVYADEAVNNQTLSEKGVNSIKLISQAIVPTQEGTLTLPDETITWWNTEKSSFETATLKSQPLTIWPANNVTQNTIPSVTESSQISANQLTNNPIQNGQFQQPPYSQNQTENEVMSIPFWVWLIIVLVLTSLWLITLLMLLRTRQQLKAAGIDEHSIQLNPNSTEANYTFNHQWCEMPLPEFYKELLRQLHDDLHIKSVESIPIERLRNAIFQLEAHLFAGEQLGYDTQQTICDNWASLITKHNQNVTKKGELSELYKN
ncbi:BatD family protein [Thiomicrorhabdus lithotrophica]|uniref:BatD family protein n=1 Tax=Thiomicrorhabdus lithotrophica TaxID=2949997 RepID=A0ABY8CDI7_9GAMM|nr:BatD family protein [Thiomicrorhabdus lithotrophica]WEJ62730.1 BatD family protein [Thiomicrorhabdus lithotrophica]